MALRSFVALELNEEVRAALTELLRQLQRTNAAVKWVEPHNLHLTLKFLGEVPEEQVPTIVEVLRTIAASTRPFSFTVCRTGGFPDLKRPRVLWVGVEAPPNLLQLQRQVEQGMAQLGFAPEDRPYHPHITLGRVKAMAGVERVRAILSEHAETLFGVVKVSHLTLFRSDLSREGPTYTPLAQLPFSSP